MVNSPRSKIVVQIYNHNNYILKKKTINVRGMFRLQLLAAAKVLTLISSAREFYGDSVTKAVIELVNIEDAKMFCSLLKQYSPIPIVIIKKREVIENVS